MHPVRELARLWHDARLRMQLRGRRATLVVASSVALGLGTLIGAGLSGASIEPAATTAAFVPETSLPATNLALPDRDLPAAAQTAGEPGKVRVISLDRDAPAAAYVYPAAPKAPAAKSTRPAASRQAQSDRRDQRSSRRPAPQREAAPPSAYRAYGYDSRQDPRRR